MKKLIIVIIASTLISCSDEPVKRERCMVCNGSDFKTQCANMTDEEQRQRNVQLSAQDAPATQSREAVRCRWR
jgi:hypothetical protein